LDNSSTNDVLQITLKSHFILKKIDMRWWIISFMFLSTHIKFNCSRICLV